jgi:hypothetical protein
MHSRVADIYDVLKEKCINDTTVRVDCKSIGLHSGWNKRKSGLVGYG